MLRIALVIPIRIPRRRATRPLGVSVAILALGLSLGACTKCDVPNLIPNKSAPQSCHDDPSPQ